MDVYARRRARLALLVEHMNKGNIASFARDYGYSRSQISQFLSETYNGGRSIGERAARTIEKRVGNPAGWLDEPFNEGEMEMLKRPFSTAELRIVTNTAQPIDSAPDPENLYLLKIPIRGEISPTKNGFFEAVQPLPGDEKRFLDIYAMSASLFAVQVKTSGLRPRIKNTEYIIADNSPRPLPGDDVIVQFTQDRFAVLQLLYIRGDEIAYGSMSESSPSMVVPQSEIVDMYIIKGIMHGETRTVTEAP